MNGMPKMPDPFAPFKEPVVVCHIPFVPNQELVQAAERMCARAPTRAPTMLSHEEFLIALAREAMHNQKEATSNADFFDHLEHHEDPVVNARRQETRLNHHNQAQLWGRVAGTICHHLAVLGVRWDTSLPATETVLGEPL